MAIKNVIFDLGKVLVNYNFDLFYEKLGCKSTSNEWDSSDELILQFEMGKFPAEEFHKRMMKIYNVDLSFEDFKQAWCGIFPDLTSLVPFAADLVLQYNVYVFSNTDELHYPHVRAKFPELEFLGENEMLSYELGAIKPDKVAFLKAIALFGLNPSECLFIDDNIDNVEAAKKFGMDALLCTNPDNCISEIKFLLENEKMEAADSDKRKVKRKGLDRRQRERRRKVLEVPIERRNIDDRRSGGDRRRLKLEEKIPFLKKMMIDLFVKK